MKQKLDLVPVGAFFASLIYLPFNPQFGIYALIPTTCLFAYQQFLNRTEQPDIMAELQKVREESDKKVNAISEAAAKEITQLRDDVAKFSLNMARAKGAVDQPKERPPIKF